MARKRKKRIVIIGNSAAGLSALEAFRKRDIDSNVLMIDKEPVFAYSRMITPYFIMGGIKKEDDLFIRREGFYKALKVRTLFGKEVLSIDTRSREVVFDKGKKEPFDTLLIATGGSPQRPNIEGTPPQDILVLRNLADAKRLKEIKMKTRNILFMGGGLVSLQTLQAMYRAGGQYTFVVKSDQIMSQTLNLEAAEMVERLLARMGVRILKGRDVVGVKKRNDSKVAILDQGEEIEMDLIFAGKGVHPTLPFLDGSGIKTQPGILVNEYLETNEEGIYAAGDVAQASDFFSSEKVNYGLWSSAVEQGETAGKNMSGLREKYPGNLRMNVTRIFATPVVSIGDFRSSKIAHCLIKKDEKRNRYRAFFLDEKGVLRGAILIGQVDDLGVIHGLIKKRKSGDSLTSSSIWKSPISYGFVYKNILQGNL